MFGEIRGHAAVKEVVKEGSSVSFNCTSNDTDLPMTWYYFKTQPQHQIVIYGGYKILEDYSQKIEVTNEIRNGEITSTFLIRNVKLSDSGTYGCRVQGSKNKFLTFSIKIRSSNSSHSEACANEFSCSTMTMDYKETGYYIF